MSDPKITNKISVRPTLEEMLIWQLNKDGIFHDPHESLHVLAEEVERVRSALAKIANYDIDVNLYDGAVESAREMQNIARQTLEGVSEDDH